MDDLQAYLFLFYDSFMTSLIFIPKTPYAVDVMTLLGIYNPYLIFIVSLIASVFGSILNWLLGTFIRKLEKFERFADRVDDFNGAENFFNQKGKWILLLSTIPLWGPFFTIGAGILRYRLFHFIILVTFSKFIGLAIAIFFS